MSFQHVRSMFGHLIKDPPKPLGRWSIDKCNTSISVTNYYNNVDHCGSCTYENDMIEKIIFENKQKKKEKAQLDEK